MSLLTVIRLFVNRLQQRRTHSYGGNDSSASESEQPTSECLAVRAAAKRAEEFDHIEGAYPPAYTHDDSDDVVLTFGQGHDWIRANERDVVEVEQ